MVLIIPNITLIFGIVFRILNQNLDNARHLRTLNDLLDKPLLHAFVLSNDPVAQPLAPAVIVLHAAQLLG